MTVVLNISYHQPAFELLTRLFHKEIRAVLIEEGARLRSEFLLSKFRVGERIASAEAWDASRELLTVIETRMEVVASRRSVPYWLHLYRRIGVMLSPDHEDKTDPATTYLVRNITELAIQKFAIPDSVKEFADSSRLSPNLALGGWMKKGYKSAVGGNAERKFRQFFAHFRRNSTWIIRDFGKKDFLGIYELEGLAYQYWRVTALLRSSGKGASIIIDESGDWNYEPNAKLLSLIISIDERNMADQSLSSLLGIWSDSGEFFKVEDDSDYKHLVIFPTYNVGQAEISGPFEAIKLQIPEGHVSNFFPHYFNSNVFIELHYFMDERFCDKHGYNIRTLLAVICALSSLAILSNKTLYEESKEMRYEYLRQSFLQLLSRGYHLYTGNHTDFIDLVIDRIEFLGFKDEIQMEKIPEVVEQLTLREAKQAQISLWSGGPRHLIFSSVSIQLIDLTGIMPFLQSLFVYLRDDIGESGTVFENSFRIALEKRGYVVYSGELRAEKGESRDLDAGVILNGKLLIFECVSIERPLDYEISKPKTIHSRIDRLEEKLEQARTLREFLEKNPKGENYDFSKCTTMEHGVVSPFVEWIWDRGNRYWLDEATPRIMSPKEAIKYLELNSEY